MKIRFCVLFLCLLANYVVAQQKSCCKPPSTHLVEDIEAVPLERIGTFDYPLASTVDSVAFYVNQGFALSFNFNELEAYMSFKKAAQLDTTSLAAMLGIILCSIEEDSYSETYDWAAKHAATIRASDLPKTDFEEFHARAIIDAQTVKRKHVDTLIENNLERMRKYYPNNAASWAFSIAFQDDGYDYMNEPMPSTETAIELCKEMDSKFDDVAAIQHIKIHLFEGYDANEIMNYQYVDELAPNSGHIAHMPGHVYYYNGKYAEANESFKRSAGVDSISCATRPYTKKFNWNRVHNAHFWALSLVEAGKYKEAQEKVKMAEKYMYQLDPEYMKEVSIVFTSFIHVPWRLERWDECVQQCDLVLENHVGDLPLDEFYYRGMRLYFEGMKLFTDDKQDSLAIKTKELKKHLKSYKSYAKKHGDKDLYGLFPKYTTNHFNQLEALYQMLKFANDNFDGIDVDEAYEKIDYIRFLVSVSCEGDPHALALTMDEFFARVWEHNKEYKEALDQLELALKTRPHSGYILLQMARMQHKLQMKEASMHSLYDFQTAWNDADEDLIEFEKARVLQLDLTK